MSTRAAQHPAVVRGRTQLSDHLVRLELEVDGFVSTGVLDEWVGLVVPGQFQSRYYTVREYDAGRLLLDVVVHDVGLVTEWAMGDVVGESVVVTEAQGSFDLPDDAAWLLLVGDLTALPAMARICASPQTAHLPTRVWAEVPDDPADLAGYLPDGVDVTWSRTADDGSSALAAIVTELDWPEGEGYFWLAGESAQMRAVRKHLARERFLPTAAYDVMGYWRGPAMRPTRAADPAPSPDPLTSAHRHYDGARG